MLCLLVAWCSGWIKTFWLSHLRMILRRIPGSSLVVSGQALGREQYGWPWNIEKSDKGYTHVLAHFLKSIRAYNVKSSSTLFLDNIQWNFEISFPCARFNSLLGYNLITKSWDHQKWDFQTPISWNWKNTLSCEIYFFEKLYSESIEFETYQDGWKN